MLDQTNIQTITISPEATQAVQNIMAEKNLEGYALRIFVSGGSCGCGGGGCGGTQFGMALDNIIKDVDTTIESDGMKIVVDNVSMEYLFGAKIEFVNDPQRGAGFVINTQQTHQHSHNEGEGCACGGSCDCNN